MDPTVGQGGTEGDLADPPSLGVLLQGPCRRSREAIRSLVTTWGDKGFRVHLTAVDSVSAGELRTATDEPVQTLATWLALRPACRGTQAGDDRVDLVVVMGAESLDLGIADALLAEIESGSMRLVLIGDELRIPPGGCDRFFIEVLRSGVASVAAIPCVPGPEDSASTAFALDLRSGTVGHPEGRGDDRRWLPVKDDATPEDVQEATVRIVREFVEGAFIPGRDLQVLAGSGGGPLGTDELARALGSLLGPAGAAWAVSGNWGRGGQLLVDEGRVVALADAPELGLRTGDAGTIRFIDVRMKLLALLETDDGRSIRIRNWADLALLGQADVLEVGLARNSRFPVVILPLHDSQELDRATLYTAAMTASRNLLIIGTESAVRRAAGRDRRRRPKGIREGLLAAPVLTDAEVEDEYGSLDTRRVPPTPASEHRWRGSTVRLRRARTAKPLESSPPDGTAGGCAGGSR